MPSRSPCRPARSRRLASRLRLVVAVLVWLAALAGPALAQRSGYPPEEFAARRQALAARLESGLVLLVGKTLPASPGRFRQDNDFYYFTGRQDLNAVMVMDAATGETHLFLPALNPSELRSEGPNLLSDPDAATRWGFASVQPLDLVSEFLARRSGGQTRVLWARLSEADQVDLSRGDRALWLARRQRNPFGALPSEESLQIDLLRTRFPYFELRDLTPAVDRLRVVKTPREIEVLRRIGRLSAEAMVRAIRATRPGRFEYELEAEATHHLLANGVQGAAYGAIVGSGANGLVWHYMENGERLEAGETIVMDYGGSLDHLTMDITRTWPVSGTFSDIQRRAYACVLEAQQAIIAAMRPGATRAQTLDVARAVFRKHGFDDRHAFGAGHFVGMSVHDVGDPTLPFEPGMVIAVEPILELAEHNLHVRIEDTVLVTDGDPVVLSADVPKDIDALLALVGRGAAPAGTPGPTSR